ncbi:MAG: FtsX-like permease family protein [Alistipes sp.]|nr:FtsX-like permease family protein [Alistipes sp.]
MAKLNIELFLARRMGQGRNASGGFLLRRKDPSAGSSGSRGGGRNAGGGVMVRIAVATVAVSLAVMIVAVAVIMGFRGEITGKIAAFTGHLRVQALDYGGSVESDPIELSAGLEAALADIPGVRSVAPYALQGGLMKPAEAPRGVVHKGVGAGYDLSFFAGCLVAGELPRIVAEGDLGGDGGGSGADGGDGSGGGGGAVRHKDILISAAVARVLRLEVDDRVEMLFVSADRPPRRDRFRVCGLFSSGLGEMDDTFAITDIANVQRLNRWTAGQVAGYEVFLADVSDSDSGLGAFLGGVFGGASEGDSDGGLDGRGGVSDGDRADRSGLKGGQAGLGRGLQGLDEFEERVVEAARPYDTGEPPLMVRSVAGDFPQLFDWLATHDVNAAVIIAIMIVVALVSMTSALLIVVLERIRMIGILKTLGMRNGAVRRIFVMRAAVIVAWGLMFGNFFGIVGALAQGRWGFLKLDAEGYFLSQVPVALDWWWIIALNVGSMAVIVAAMILPTTIVSRVTPSESVRYQ